MIIPSKGEKALNKKNQLFRDKTSQQASSRRALHKTNEGHLKYPQLISY